MEDDVPSFPLLHLPKDALNCVLHNMDLFYQIAFSIISERSKALVRSLNLEIEDVSLSVGGGMISVDVLSPHRQQIQLHFHSEGIHEPTKMYTPDFVETNSSGEGRYYRSQWKKPGFEIKDWIDHLLSLFNRSKLNRLVCAFQTFLNLESLKKTVNDVIEIDIVDRCHVGIIDQIVQTFNTAKKLSLEFENLPVLKSFHKHLSQSYDVLTLYSWHAIPTRRDLDDLLIMNSRSVRLNNSTLTEKHFNKFFHHWIEGSNPRMEHFGICFSRVENNTPNKEIILKGLNYMVAPSEQKRVFTTPYEYGYGLRTITVEGGYDIQRNDGTTATIIIRNRGMQQPYHLEFFAWLG